MQTSLIEADTRTLMEQWGRWAGQNQYASLAYPSIEPFRIMVGGGLGMPCILDATAVLIDKAVAHVIARDELMGVVTALYYISRKDYSEIAEQVTRRRQRDGLGKINRQNVAELVRSGTAAVDMALTFDLAAA